MTAKQWFNRNRETIEARMRVKVRAMAGDGTCRYRANGKADDLRSENCCFFGICIPKSRYRKKFDTDLTFSEVLKAIGVSGGSKEFQVLVGLQRIHDHGNPYLWESEYQIWREKELPKLG